MCYWNQVLELKMLEKNWCEKMFMLFRIGIIGWKKNWKCVDKDIQKKNAAVKLLLDFDSPAVIFWR